MEASAITALLRKRHAFCLFFLLVSAAGAAERQRVQFAPFVQQNAADLPEHGNLGTFIENRLTKSLRSKIGRNFDLVDTPAKGSPAADSRNPSEGADFVISGEYTLHNLELRLKVRVFEAETKKTAEFKYEGQADSTIDNLIDEVARDLQNRMSELDSVVIAEQRKMGNQLGVYSGASFFSTPPPFSAELGPEATLTPADINGTLQLGLEYRLKNVWLRDLAVFFAPRFESGKRMISVQNNTTQISASVIAFSGCLGLGYTFRIGKAFYWGPFLGGGYYYGKMQLDYGNLSATPYNLGSSRDERSRELQFQTPIGRADIRAGYHIGKNLSLELSVGNTVYFYKEQMPMAVFAILGVAYAF